MDSVGTRSSYWPERLQHTEYRAAISSQTCVAQYGTQCTSVLGEAALSWLWAHAQKGTQAANVSTWHQLSFGTLHPEGHTSSKCRQKQGHGHGIRSFFDANQIHHAVDPQDYRSSNLLGVSDFKSLMSEFKLVDQKQDLPTLRALVPRLEKAARTSTERHKIGLLCWSIARQHIDAEDPDLTNAFFYLQRALDIFQSLGRIGSSEHAICIYLLGCACIMSKRFEDAIQHFEQAALFLKDFDAAKEPMTKEKAIAVERLLRQTQLSCCLDLLEYFSRQQEENPAELGTLALETALAIACTPPGQKDLAAKIEDKIGTVQMMAGEAEKAFTYLESSIAKKKEIHGLQSLKLVTGLYHLAMAYICAGRLSDALEQFKAADKIFSKHKGEDHSIDEEASYLYISLVNLYSSLGRLDDAIECQKTLIELSKRKENQSTGISVEEAENILKALVQRAKL